MTLKKPFSLIAAMAVTLTVSAFDARYSPSELFVTWPDSETPNDKPALIFSHPLLGDTNILTGTVSVNGNERPFLAKLDPSGNVEWSKRMPFSGDDLFDGFSLVDESHLIVSFMEGDPEDPSSLSNRIGSFNPANGFSARFTYSLPPMPVDPLNPLGASIRSFQAQRDGKLAIIQVEGNDANVLMLDETGSQLFAKTYVLPSGGGGSPFPIPGFGLSYNFVSVSELENGDFYLTTNGADLLSQSVKGIVLRLNSSGDIIWQRTVDMPGTTAFVSPRLDESILIAGNGMGGLNGLATSVVLLDETGTLKFATTVEDALLNGYSFEHFAATGNILLQGTLAVSASLEDFLSDGVALILSDTGEKINETAYDLGDYDALFHIGTIGGNLYFELFGLDTESGSFTHGILTRSDANLENWISRSYLEIAGPSANFSAFFGENGSPYLTYRDTDPDWINVNKLDDDLMEIGDCELLTDTTVVPYDPNLTLSAFSPNIAQSGITASNWTATPTLTNDPFALEDSPFTVEFVCGNTGGGGDPVSLWDDVPAANPEGDRKAGIGWVNDVAYPYIWHYSIGGWIYILDEFSDLENIFGWDYVNGFWFWANNAWGGWYINLENPEWGIGGWDKWE